MLYLFFENCLRKWRITTDLAVARKLTDNISFTLGGVNIFNVYPTRQDTETESGGLWDPVQMGFNGAFYYARLRFKLK